MSDVLSRTVNLVTEECITCGTVFGLSATLRNHCYQNGGYFYCPVGHSQGWNTANCKTNIDKLSAEIARLKSLVDYKDSRIEAERCKAAAAKTTLTKERNRLRNGVCPCCNRHFVNVERHLKTKHPNFAEVI